MTKPLSEVEKEGNNEAKKIWSSCGSTYCTSVARCIIITLYMSVLEPIVKRSHTRETKTLEP